MTEQELAQLVAAAAGVEQVQAKNRPGAQIKANALWEGSCSPTQPRKRVGLFLVRDGATTLATEGAHRRLTLALPFPEAALIISRPSTPQQQVTLVGYSDSARLRRMADAFGIAPEVVERPSFVHPATAETEQSQPPTANEDDLERLISNLRETPNLVLQGPPGTGKSSLALALARSMAQGANVDVDDCRFSRLVAVRGGEPDALLRDTSVLQLPLVWEFVQLHPGYAYDDLVRRVVPGTGSGGHLQLRVEDSLLPHLCRLAAARGPDKPVMLVLDEINRCNLASVFGEFLLGLDAGHRGLPVRLQVQGSGLDATVAMPSNLWVVGTMNTADRSIAMVDYAVRRRFRFLEIRSTREAVKRWYMPDAHRAELAGSLFDSCNSGLPTRLRIGPSPFLVRVLPSDDWPARLARRVAYEVLPLLCEYAKEGLRDRSPVLFGSSTFPIENQKRAAIQLAEILQERQAINPQTGESFAT